MLKQYEAMLPGLANRIIAMAEQEAAHRRKIEEDIVKAQLKDAEKYRVAEIVGQVCGLIIGITAIGGATYSAVHGAQWTGGFIGTAGVTGLVTAFILGRTLQMRQRKEDAETARKNAREFATITAAAPGKTTGRRAESAD